jgi:hypothetical protein
MRILLYNIFTLDVIISLDLLKAWLCLFIIWLGLDQFSK